MNARIADTGLYTRCIMFIDAVFELQEHVKAQTDPKFPIVKEIPARSDLFCFPENSSD